MCGRFTLTSSEEQIAAVLPGLVFDEPVKPRYNIAPTQSILAVLNENAGAVTPVHWGLIPSWAKDPAIGNRMINARAETVHEKPSYRRPLARQRCLVLADGFYEWKRVPGQKAKVPMYIRMRDATPFAFAGLWDRWRAPDRSVVTSATIITTTPNALMKTIHDRMPVILPATDWSLWLTREAVSAEDVLPILRPCSPELMEAYEVSTRVNRPANDEPACLEPADQV